MCNDTKITRILVFCVTFLTIHGKLVYKVKCPDDEKLRKMITAKKNGENFDVQCSNPIPGENH